MDPVIRITVFLVITAALARNDFTVLTSISALVVLLHLAVQQTYFQSHLNLVRRMRWLFLALMIIYFWFTPGEPVIGDSHWWPTQEGIEQGLLRIASLMLVIISVNFMIQNSTREQLMGGLYWLSFPFKYLGLSRERLMLRLMLTLDHLTHMQETLHESYKNNNGGHGRVARMADVLSDAFAGVIRRADNTQSQTITIPECASPPVYQWLYPLSLAAVLWWIH